MRRSPLQETFGGRVRARRIKLGLSQEEFAAHAGLDRTYIGSLERGERNVSLSTLAVLADALDVDLGDLLRGLTT